MDPERGLVRVTLMPTPVPLRLDHSMDSFILTDYSFYSFIYGHLYYTFMFRSNFYWLDTASATTVQFLQRTHTIYALYLVLRSINAIFWHPSSFSHVLVLLVCGLIRYSAYYRVRDRPFSSSASHDRDGSRAHGAQSCVSLPTSSTHAIGR